MASVLRSFLAKPSLSLMARSFNESTGKQYEYTNTTILVESSSIVQELPLAIRKVNNINIIEEKPDHIKPKSTENNYQLIQDEFQNCLAYKDVFSLLAKCTKITPNIALGAMERMYYIEKNMPFIPRVETSVISTNTVNGAIVDKLLNVVKKADDTQTLLNSLNAISSFIQPHKETFCEELLLRVMDNKLTLIQLCQFMQYLIDNKETVKQSELIDKLWVGFIERQNEIDHNNIAIVYNLLTHFKTSRRVIFNMLEEKFILFWPQLTLTDVISILNVYIQHNHWCSQIFSYAGRWLNTNIHKLDDDSLLEIITKFNKLFYNDDQIQKAVERYVKMKRSKIQSPILIVGLLNYCMQFHMRSELIMEYCCEHFLSNPSNVPHSFLKSITYPYGYLQYNPTKNDEFWSQVNTIVSEKFHKIPVEDIMSIVLSCMYLEKYPMDLINKLFHSENVIKITDPALKKKLQFIDTSLCLQNKDYAGPMVAKVQWTDTKTQDARIRNAIEKIKKTLVKIAGSDEQVSVAVALPHLSSYLVDIMLHPVGWKLTTAKNNNVAILIHLPEHYCCNNETLLGPQKLRILNLRLLGMKVVSLNYTLLCNYYTNYDLSLLENYINNCIDSSM